MRLLITSKVTSVTLPLNYQYIQQSILYNYLSKDLTQHDFVHDQGWKYGDRSYHMFQFSRLEGPFSIHGKEITFHDCIKWEVRSIDSRIIHAIANGIKREGITYLGQKAMDSFVCFCDDEIEASSVHIRMRTPICVYSTDSNTGKTFFYSPDSEEFFSQIVLNFYRKYCAYTGMAPKDEIRIQAIRVLPQDKFVTNYKGFFLSGWRGEYNITGNRKYINFLYQVGLGARNAQGFGMFDIVD